MPVCNGWWWKRSGVLWRWMLIGWNPMRRSFEWWVQNGHNTVRPCISRHSSFDVTNMKSRAIRELASAYTKLFELRLCDTQENHIAETTTVVNITIRPQCPQPSTITISYEPCSDVNSDIQRAPIARQHSATYIAHRFLALDAWFSSLFCWETGRWETYPGRSHGCVEETVKALVPFMLPLVNQYVAHDTVLGSRRIHHPDLSSTNIMFDADTENFDWDHW